MARRIAQAFRIDGLNVEIFNNGELRRKLTGPETSRADFFSPLNEKAVVLREELAGMNLERASRFLKNRGDVAIIDAANVTRARRNMIQKWFHYATVLFLECVNSDHEVLEANLKRKASLEEFRHLSHEESIKEFQRRIENYEKVYEPLCEEPNQLVLDSFEGKIIKEVIRDWVPYYERLRDVVVTRYVSHLYLVRHGETFFNLEDRIGGDPDLTPRGWRQAEILARHFSQERIPIIFTSNLKRAIHTAIPIARAQGHKNIVPLKEFNEIYSGVCEEMTYKEIRERFPQVYETRSRDKYGYVYPGGEGYVTMEERIERGIKKVFYLSAPEDSIMIVGHRAVNRMILSHFVYRRKEEVPYIYMPQDGYYHIRITPNVKLFQLRRFERTEWR